MENGEWRYSQGGGGRKGVGKKRRGIREYDRRKRDRQASSISAALSPLLQFSFYFFGPSDEETLFGSKGKLSSFVRPERRRRRGPFC